LTIDRKADALKQIEVNRVQTSVQRKFSLALLLAVATVLAAPFVLFSTFTGVSWFDDEGTLLIGFRSLLDGHRMYDEIYSLYGPLYNAVYGLVYIVLHVPVTHVAGRLIAAGFWLAYTAGFAAFCQCLTRSTATTLFAYLLVLIWLAPLMQSPGHPQELCLLLLVAVLLLACSIESTDYAASLAGIGASVAGLALVKINVGVYVGSGLVLALLCITAPRAWTRITIPIVTIGLLLLPFAVQEPLFSFRWARLYGLFSALAIAAALLVFFKTPREAILKTADWGVIFLGGGLTCVTAVGGMMLAGTSVYAIFNATLLQYTHFAQNWNVPFYVSPLGGLAAMASFLAAVAYRASELWSPMREYRNIGVVALKSGFVLLGVQMLLFSSEEEVLRILVPFSWLLMVPPAQIRQRQAFVRSVASLVSAILSLYPFPVFGDAQIRIGALLPVMMIPILADDLLKTFPERKASKQLLVPFRSNLVAVVVVLAVGAVVTVRSGRTYWHAVPLELPGTSLIRVERKQADDIRWVTAQLSSCASSYSLPGLFSFSFWTGHAAPTPLNINDVLAFIPSRQQQAIVEALSRQPDLCIVYNPEYLRSFDRGQIAKDPPLLHYLQADFIATEERDGFIILKRRTSVP
jgi:hypothetical protein